MSRISTITLLDDHISISHGTPTVIQLTDVTGFRREDSFNGEHWSGAPFLVLTLRGQEVGFGMKAEYVDVWLKALGGNLQVAR